MPEVPAVLSRMDGYPNDPIAQAREAALERGAWQEGYRNGADFVKNNPTVAQDFVDKELTNRFPHIYRPTSGEQD